MKILMLNPNTSDVFTKDIQLVADEYKAAGTEVVAVNPDSGPRSIEGIYDELLSALPSLETLIPREPDFDAFIIACYSDHPVIHATREITRKPVLGIMEATLYTACMLGHTFSVVTTNDRWKPLLWDAVRRYGLADRCASVRTTGLAVLELESGDEQNVRRCIYDEARLAIEQDDAEVICLGCAGMAGFDKELQEELGVPVIDGVAASVKLIEALVGYGVETSKIRAYSAPDGKQLLNMPPMFEQSYKVAERTKP